MTPRFFICGLSHSGTTLLSEIFRQVPGLNSGFEVGVLLCRSPRRYPSLLPYSRHMIAGWGVTSEDIAEISQTDEFTEFYQRLAERSPLINDREERIFDKTPAYLEQIKKCYSRCPGPYIILYRDIRGVLGSFMKRQNIGEFERWWPAFLRNQWPRMKRAYNNFIYAKNNPDRFFLINYERLVADPNTEMKKVFDWLSIPFEPNYLDLSSRRYPKIVHEDAVSTSYLHEFRTVFSSKQEDIVVRKFAKFDDWILDL